MANTPQAKKRIRRNDRRAEINGARVSRIRSFLKKVELAIEGGDKKVAAEARRERRRRRSRKKKRSAWLTTVLENLGWIILGVALGVPLLAGLLYLAGL